jgi:hypothetical protein
MFLNLLCYVLIDLFDVFGVMDLFDGYLTYDDADFFDPFE